MTHPGQRPRCDPPPTSRGGGGVSRPLGRVVEAAAAEGLEEAAAAVDEGQRKPPRRWASARRSGCSQAGQRQRNLRSRVGAEGTNV